MYSRDTCYGFHRFCLLALYFFLYGSSSNDESIESVSVQFCCTRIPFIPTCKYRQNDRHSTSHSELHIMSALLQHLCFAIPKYLALMCCCYIRFPFVAICAFFSVVRPISTMPSLNNNTGCAFNMLHVFKTHTRFYSIVFPWLVFLYFFFLVTRSETSADIHSPETEF